MQNRQRKRKIDKLDKKMPPIFGGTEIWKGWPVWIAACDDDPHITKQLNRTLPEIISRDDHFTLYNGGMELLDAARNSPYPIDVLLLDMELPGLSGIEIACELRTINSSTVIIVLTAHTKYALNCYQFRAMDYLTKPLDPTGLKSVIDEARYVKPSQDYLRVNTKDTDAFVSYSDILYIESINRALYIRTRGGEYKTSHSISRLYAELQAKGFYRPHKSFIVNMAHVRRIDKAARTVYLTDGSQLPVSGHKQTDFTSALLHSRTGAYGL